MPNRVNRLMAEQEKKSLKTAGALVFVGYCGLTAAEAEEMRKTFRGQALKVRVLRNRMALRALSDLGAPDCGAVVTGPTAVIDAECPVTAARAAMAFARRHPKLELKGGLIEGAVYDKAAIEKLAASGRTKAEWRSAIASCLLSPFQKVAGCAASGGRVAGAVKTIADKAPEGGATPPPGGEKPAA
jgi:large subunit ribosomal protein L10